MSKREWRFDKPVVLASAAVVMLYGSAWLGIAALTGPATVASANGPVVQAIVWQKYDDAGDGFYRFEKSADITVPLVVTTELLHLPLLEQDRPADILPPPKPHQPVFPKPKPKEPQPTQTIDELIEALLALRSSRSEIDKQEKDLVVVLRKMIEEQQAKLSQIGVLINNAPPVVKPVPVQPPPPPVPVPTITDEFAAAWKADRDGGQGTYQDLRSLAAAYASAGEALERSRPPTVGHLLSGLEIRNRVQLKDRLPRVQVLAKQFLAQRLPPSGAVLTPITPAGVKVDSPPEVAACKQVLLELASMLERIAP